MFLCMCFAGTLLSTLCQEISLKLTAVLHLDVFLFWGMDVYM